MLVVGGGDSALESAIALAGCGAHVTCSYRKPEFARPKPENVEKLNALVCDPKADVQVEKPTSERVNTALTRSMVQSTPDGSITLALATQPLKIEADKVTLKNADGSLTALPNDVVFSMIGREAPLDFFRRSGLHVRGDWRASTWISCIAFVLFCVLLYHWKSNHPNEFPVQKYFAEHQWFPARAPAVLDAAGGTIAEWSNREGNLLFTIKKGLGNPAFYYTLAYCTCVVVFGVRRIKRRRTPYVTRQTIVLMCSQCIPLFILPEIILPWIGRNGFFEQHSPLRWLADNLFESYDGSLGHERAYWRAYGFILAWPLNVYNVFTPHPMWLWLGISFVQTFVVIPLIIFRWGKGAYCGWICSCGALAETMGDTHRAKMPHGPFWNRVNMVGQVALAFAVAILGLRIAGWALGENSWAAHWFKDFFEGIPFLNYSWSVDIFMGGILGVGLYFWFSGRVWCRFACPLAALMHIYARFSRFRIFPREIEMHFLQRLHLGLSSRDRHHELREQRPAHAGPGVRALLGVRAAVPDRRARLRTLRQRASDYPRYHSSIARANARGLDCTLNFRGERSRRGFRSSSIHWSRQSFRSCAQNQPRRMNFGAIVRAGDFVALRGRAELGD